ITGQFYVPSYQRGYRWGKDEVTRLLDDIYSNGNKNYCLQPVVIKKDGERYELIDGQQRLTTLFILLQYIKKEFKPRINLKYSLTYETRSNSATFLQNIDLAQANSNIDYFHIAQAYQTIDEWFRKQSDDVVVADDVYGYLVKHVKIIWYEVGENEDAIGLFTRLNIGKIPLTSAELVKAMFLSRDNSEHMDREKQEEISLQWDNIEKELHNDALWYFLTNSIKGQYQTRIDLVLDLISGKQDSSREKYYTFFRFDEMRKEKSLDEIWRKIQQTFLILKDWFENHELYHKIGYLIASNKQTLYQIYKLSEHKKKNEFIASLNALIRKSIRIVGNYSELSYTNRQEYDKISTLLLLFNVESVRQNGEHTQWFPFDKFKYNRGSKVSWSLEHIHAQQSEGMRTQEVWKEWLELHIPSVKAIGPNYDALIQEMQDAIVKAKLERTEFESLQQKVLALLSVSGNTEYLHSIANLALLNTADNAALNNSTFDVKRNVIVDMDKKGQYIPFCTKMVFLKYYTPSEHNQLHFWGQADRVAYVNAINTVLADYLDDPIALEKEDAQ
ncbi:MAG: DUF262 domain-containing protein, partial [Tyzzerella sp.]|nr:DUF262 domain-containing protein [Tyzzerella sp.]